MSSRVYVGNFPYRISDQELIELFSTIGKVKGIKKPVHEDTGRAKGFCFIEYADKESGPLAIEKLQGVVIGGRSIKVAEAVQNAKSPAQRIEEKPAPIPEPTPEPAPSASSQSSPSRRELSEQLARMIAELEADIIRLGGTLSPVAPAVPEVAPVPQAPAAPEVSQPIVQPELVAVRHDVKKPAVPEPGSAIQSTVPSEVAPELVDDHSWQFV